MQSRNIRVGVKDGMKWAAFLTLRNEEHNIDGVMASIMDQSARPSRILVFDDGSTDRTGEMLDGMTGVTVSHGPPHPPQHSHPDFIARRFGLMKAALPGMDYVVCVDADVRLEPRYVERVTHRMELDGAAIASGADPSHYTMRPIEQGMVIDAKWVRGRHMLHQYALNFLCAEAADDGRSCAVYRDIAFSTSRTFGVNYGANIEWLRGANQRQRGMAWYWALYMLVRGRKWSWWRGYVSYRGHKLPAYHGKWCNDFLMAQQKRKLGLKQDMIIDKNSATYIVPRSQHGR